MFTAFEHNFLVCLVFTPISSITRAFLVRYVLFIGLKCPIVMMFILDNQHGQRSLHISFELCDDDKAVDDNDTN